MVRIGLKPQFVDLIVTLLSGAAEFCLLKAALNLNRYAECNALRRGKQINVRVHQVRTRYFATMTIIIFVVLELMLSFFSNPLPGERGQEHRCASVDRYDVIPTNVFSVTTDKVMLQCLRMDGDQIFQSVGNISLEDGKIRCSRFPLYRFTGEGMTEAVIRRNQTKSCIGDDDICSFVEVRMGEDHGHLIRVLYLSAPIVANELDSVISEGLPVPYLATTVLFEIENDQEVVLAQRAANAFSNGVSDPTELRRRVLTGSTDDTKCQFLFEENDVATEVPLALIYIIAATWVISLLGFILSLFFTRHVFYDVSDPLHWAKRTFRFTDETISEDPVVTCVYEHGEQIMYVTGSSCKEVSFLKRMEALMLCCFRRKR